MVPLIHSKASNAMLLPPSLSVSLLFFTASCSRCKRDEACRDLDVGDLDADSDDVPGRVEEGAGNDGDIDVDVDVDDVTLPAGARCFFDPLSAIPVVMLCSTRSPPPHALPALLSQLSSPILLSSAHLAASVPARALEGLVLARF